MNSVSDAINMPLAACRTLYILALTLFLTTWLEQDTIALYWRQAHHVDSSIRFLKIIPVWASGAQVNEFSAHLNAARIDEMAQFDDWALSMFNGDMYALENPLALTPKQENDPLPEAVPEVAVFEETPEANAAKPAPQKISPAKSEHASVEPGQEDMQEIPLDNTVRLRKKDHVLFAGDSLMQGVAPHVNASLYRRYGIRGFDLSRQSTGLSYPGFFNWPDQIKKTFLEKPDIKLLVVFLGPNDPWDLPHTRNTPYLKFRSEKWETVYRGRIREILEAARENRVRVLWIAPPCMREKALSQKMAYLNEIFSNEVGKRQEFFLTTGDIVGCDSERFESYMYSGEKKIRSRADDGIHFTLAGQKKIAAAILSFIHFIPGDTVQ